jgi:hypothetical protein
MKVAALFLAVAALAGCGSDAASQAPRYDVTISYWPAGRGGEPRSATLQCDPDGGSHPAVAAACDALLQHEDALQPVAGDVACTEIYGGPELATISGPNVHATLSRRNGCEIARWDALAPVVELPAS